MKTEITKITNLDLNLDNLQDGKIVINEMLDKMLDSSKNLLVVSADTRAEASDILSYAKKANKFFDATRVKIKAPFLDKGREIDGFFNQFEQTGKIISIAKNNIMAYDAKIEEERRVEERRLAKIQAKFDAKRKTTIEDVEKVSAQRTEVDSKKTANTQHSGTGSKTTYRTVTNYTVTDKSKIPLKYMEANMVMIRSALSSKIVTDIPGIKVTKDKVL